MGLARDLVQSKCLANQSSQYSEAHTAIKSHNGPGTVAHTCNPSTLGGRGRWIMRSGDGGHPGQQGEILSLLKIQKLAGHGGTCL